MHLLPGLRTDYCGGRQTPPTHSSSSISQKSEFRGLNIRPFRFLVMLGKMIFAGAREETKKWLTATVKKVIFVKNRLLNFIV